MHAGCDLGRRQVDRLLGRAALEVDGRSRGLDREPLLQPGVAPDVQSLRAELGHAARDHVLHLARVDARALDHRPVGRSQQLIGVGVLVVALLEVAPADWCPGGLDNDYLAAGLWHLPAPCSLAAWETGRGLGAAARIGNV